MKITKFGHSCILVEEREARILFDPGCYSYNSEKIQNIDVILITHEHPDHTDLNLIKTILQNNKGVKIFTNSTVHDNLKKENIESEVMKDGDQIKIKDVKIEAIGKLHALIYKTIPICENVCFFIADRLYHPGDSFTIPNNKVEILALPTEAPWMKMADAIEFGLKINPKSCFPIHDGRLRPDRIGPSHRVPKLELEKTGTEYIILEENKEYEF